MIITQFSQVETNPWKILLGDFGLSQIIEGTNTIGTKTMLTRTPGFQPPEQLRSESIGLTNDIYALGAVLLVLFSEKPVWPKLSPYQIMFKVTVSGEKPDTTILPSQLQEVCRACYRDVALRPKAHWVLQRLLHALC